MATETVSGDENESDQSPDDEDSGNECGTSASEDRLVRQMRRELVPDSQPPPAQHFYVGLGSDAAVGSECDNSGLEASQQGAPTASELDPPAITPAIAALLALPEITPPPSRRRAPQDALIDYL